MYENILEHFYQKAIEILPLVVSVTVDSLKRYHAY